MHRARLRISLLSKDKYSWEEENNFFLKVLIFFAFSILDNKVIEAPDVETDETTKAENKVLCTI